MLRDAPQKSLVTLEQGKSRQRPVSDGWLMLGEPRNLEKNIEEKMQKTLETYPMKHLPTCGSEHVGVQPQKQEGYSYLNIPIISGVLSTEKMLRIAQIAEEYGNGDLRLTPFQNIILANIPNDSLTQTAKKIEEAGYQATDAYLKWATIVCAGNFCGKTLDHPKNRAAEAMDYLEKRFGEDLKKAKLRVSFSGCPNGCARHLIADIGFQGSTLTSEGKSTPAYNIFVRDSVESDSGLGNLVQRGIRAEQAKFALANLIEAHLKNKVNMSFNKFCNTKSLEELQAIINSNTNSKINTFKKLFTHSVFPCVLQVAKSLLFIVMLSGLRYRHTFMFIFIAIVKSN